MTKAAELAKMGEVLTNSQIGGRRNIVINGAMQVAQRATSETGLGASSKYSTVDRFNHAFDGTAGRLTSSQVASGLNGFGNALKLDCTTADTSIAAGELFIIQQRIEGQDLQQLKKGTSDAEQVTLSFYAKVVGSSTDIVVELEDADNSRHVAKLFTLTTSWARYTYTFPADTTGALDDDNASSFLVNFWLHAGSTYNSGTLATSWASKTEANRAVGADSFFSSTDNELFLTGLQLEVGSVATPFEHRSFTEELMLCQRYYYQVKGPAKGRFAAGNYFSTTQGDITIPFGGVKQRGTHALEHSGVSTINVTSASAEVACSALALDTSGGDMAACVRFTVGSTGYSSGAVGQVSTMICSDGDAFIAFDAEL